MADIQIAAKLQGKTVDDHSLPLLMLASFATKFQKTLDQVAFVLENDSGRDKKAIQKEMVLRLTATQHGSLEMVMQPEIVDLGSTVARALEALIDGLVQLRIANSTIPNGYDQGVLTLLSDLGKFFKRGIDAIEFDLSTPQFQKTVIYDYFVFSRVQDLIEEPDETDATLEGNLLGINYKENRFDEFKLALYLNDGTRVGCTFDEDLAETVRDGLRHYVHIIGRAITDPITDKVTKITIKRLTILDLPERATEDQLKAEFAQYLAENDTVAHFQEAWAEAMTGKTYPISKLWDDLDAE